MFIPEWLLILVVVVVICAIYSLVKQCKYQKALAVRNYRQWGLMRFEFERLAQSAIILHQRLYEHPELVKEIEDKIGGHTSLDDLDMWHEAYIENDYVMTFRKVRGILYKHWSKYDYADVEQDMNYFGKYRGE